MNTVILGSIIKKRRLELGITQEQLCEGICEPPSLSKIENGWQQPSKEKLNALMERIGISHEFYYTLNTKREFDIYELRYQIVQANKRGNHEEVKKLLDDLIPLVKEDDRLNQQFILRIQAALAPSLKLSQEVQLEMLYDAINLTHPEFDEKKLYKYLLSFEEIKIVIQIGVVNFKIGRPMQSIRLLQQVLEYLEEEWIDVEERARAYPLVTYNLSKYLGMQGGYAEAIEVADKGIRYCRVHQRMEFVALLMVNKCYCLYELGKQEEALQGMKQAYATFILMDYQEEATSVKDYVWNKMKIAL